MTPIALNTVEPTLASRIALDAKHHYGLVTPPDLVAAWRIDNPYSTVLCLQFACKDWSKRFFAKLAKSPQADKATLCSLLRTEFEILQRLEVLPTTTTDHGTVTPLALYADIPSIVTVDAQGTTLRHAYARRARVFSRLGSRRSLLSLARLAGRWLAAFQTQTSVGQGEFPVDELLQYCQTRLDRIRKHHSGTLSDEQVERLTFRARALAQSLALDTLRITGRHNDFASHNIIARPDGSIRVLDFQSFDHGPEAFDACNFWFELEMLKFDPTYSAELLAGMQQEFLRSYGRIDPMQADFQLARLRYAINRLLNELDGSEGLQRLSLRRRRSVRGTRAWLAAFGTYA
jgi:hypothetical protein